MDKKGSLLLIFAIIAAFVIASYFLVFKTGLNIYSSQGAGSYVLDYGCTSNANCSPCLECSGGTCQYIADLTVDTGVCDTTNINGSCLTIPCHCNGAGTCLGRVNPTLTIDSSPSWAEVFGTATTVTGAGCLAGLTCGLKRGGGSVSNPDVQTLNAGNHSYNYSTDGNDLYNAASASNKLSITGATASGTITGNGTFEYPHSTNVEGTESNSQDADVLYKLYRAGVEVSNPDTTALKVGSYAYVYNSTEGQNYSSSSSLASGTLTITQNTSTLLGIDGTTPIEYPIETDVSGSDCPAELGDCVLDKANGVYGVGVVTFNYSTTGNENYSSTSITKYITINQNTSTALSLAITPSNSETSGTETTTTASGCPAQLTCTLAIDGTPVSNPDVQTLAAGTYDYNYSTPGNENYSATSVFETLTISAASVSCGDGTCNNGETCSSCSQDCGSCSSGSPLPVCGNNLIEAHEQCDGTDNAVCVANGKVCNSDCECVNIPAVAVCGDGIKSANEQCDDGNLVNKEGCSSDCEIEEQEIIEQICGPWMKHEPSGIFYYVRYIPFIGTYFKDPYLYRDCPVLDENRRILFTYTEVKIDNEGTVPLIPLIPRIEPKTSPCCGNWKSNFNLILGIFNPEKTVSRDCTLSSGDLIVQVVYDSEKNNVPDVC